MTNIINTLSRKQKQIFVFFLDSILSTFATTFSLGIYDDKIIFSIFNYLWVYLFFIFSFFLIFLLLGLYKQVFRYFNFKNIIIIIYALFLYLILTLILSEVFELKPINKAIIFFQSLLFFMMILVSRLAFISFISRSNSGEEVNVIFLYGVNENSVNLLNLLNNTKLNKAVLFIDNDKKYQKSNINTIPVKDPSGLDELIRIYSPNEIILSDKYDSFTKRNIIKSLERYNLRIRSMPNLENISDAYYRSSLSKPLSLEDLVDRKQTRFVNTSYSFKQKVILITGAGGSIGSEIVRQLCSFRCKKLILLDNSEFNLYSINKEVHSLFDDAKLDIEIITVLMSIKDEKKLDNIFSKYNPDFVFHAAAYKHVSILEDNIIEAIENNFIGTKNLVDASIKYKSRNFCFISTDKAVNPKTIMGSSKRLAELYIQSVYKSLSSKNESIPIFSIVRFGNVFNSSGSVVPLFNQQIYSGGPVTVTSTDVERYFMSISEAVNLVLQSTELSNDCSIFVLDMGSPVKIIDLARNLIKLSGLSEKNKDNPDGDIEIKITGISSYEKISEELSIDKTLKPTDNESIFQDKLEFIDLKDLESLSDRLADSIKGGNTIKLNQLISEFN